jgi:small subunit ribosomal protein S8
MTDPLSDLLTRLRNAQQKRLKSVSVPYSKIKSSLVEILKQEGYIGSYLVTNDPVATKSINVQLKYINEQPVIKNIQRISTPGQRIYLKTKELPRSLGGLGVFIVSTSAGLMTDRQARQKKLGGEVLCEVY